MKKLTRREIEKVAKRLCSVFWRSNATKTWRFSLWRDEWRRVAEDVLINYTPIDPTPSNILKVARSSGALKPLERAPKSKYKSCRIVDGKVVCK